jgi:3-oxoacyl-(acyl-carrier-protein) synthase III
MAIGILGVGAYVPDGVVGNDLICAWTGVTTEWIERRTGITERRYADPATTTSELAARAATDVLDRHPGAREKLAGIIVATCTPDVPQPATAAILQHRLGLGQVPAFDVNAVCSGFLYSLAIADGLLRDRPGEYLLVVGADKFSTIMDRADRRTVTIFGDGAGAVLLGTVPDGYGIVASRLASDGEYHHFVGVEAGGTRTPLDRRAREAGEHLLRMDGRSVSEYAITTMRKLIEQALDDGGIGVADVDRFVFHQANPRLLETLAGELGAPMDRVVLTAPLYGNTAGASIPVTLDHTHRERPLARGERVLFASVGGGMNAAATLLTWY